MLVYKNKKENLFLLIHQNNGHWAFPKGGMEQGESKMETALRELKEETGITLNSLLDNSRIFEEYKILEKDLSITTKQVVYFVGFSDTQEVLMQEEEIQDFIWLSFHEALDKLTYDGTREVLKKANTYIESN